MEHNTQFLESEPVGRLMHHYPLRHLPAGGGALQHRGSDLHRQRQLSGFLRKCRQYGGLSPDGGGAGHRRQHRQSHTITVEQTAVVSLSKRTSPA